MSKRDPDQIKTVQRFKRVVKFVPITKQIKTVGPIYIAFGETVRTLRHESGMTQEDLSKKVGLRRASVANIETGRQRVLLADLFIFAKALGVPPKKLFAALTSSQGGD